MIALVTKGRVRASVLSELGDPTTYTVVTDRFHELDDAEKYRDQLAHWHRSVFDEREWRAVA